MRIRLLLAVAAASFAVASRAQISGASVYRPNQSGSSGAQANENAKRTIAKEDMPPSSSSMFVDASVMSNVKADQYVAVFGISLDGQTLEECNQKVSAMIDAFGKELKAIGVSLKDIDVDYVAQNRVYGFDLANDVAKEKVVGFELKKNVSVRFKDRAFIDKLLEAAAKVQIFDLIKVDYIVNDLDAVRDKLMEAASAVIKKKAANHAKLIGIPVGKPVQVYAEKYASYYPSDMYDSYVAAESEDASQFFYRQRYTVLGARKARTFYYNALNAKSFDRVLNPVVTEPVVQVTLYLKVKYDKALAAAKKK